MKRTTSQWRSVSSGMPLPAAIASAICSFHCSASVRNPSASTSTGASAIRGVVMSCLLSAVNGDPLLAGRGHRRSDAGDVAAAEEGVPVDPLEGELAEVIQARLAQQGKRAESGREPAGQRLGLVVEVDQQRLVEAGFDEAVRMPVERCLERLAEKEAGDVQLERLALEVGDRTCLR